MIVIFILLPLSVLIGTGFLAAFIWAVRDGQFDDTCTPPLRLLLEERRRNAVEPASKSRPE